MRIKGSKCYKNNKGRVSKRPRGPHRVYLGKRMKYDILDLQREGNWKEKVTRKCRKCFFLPFSGREDIARRKKCNSDMIHLLKIKAIGEDSTAL